MSRVRGMILQWGSTIKVSIQLPDATVMWRDMTKKMSKATLKGMCILLTLPHSFPPSSLWHQMLCKNVNVALVDYLCQGFYALNKLYGTCVTWEFWFTNEISKRRLENALLTEQIERQVMFCTVTSRLLHDDEKVYATLARLYNFLEDWREMKTVFGRNILIRTDDLLFLFDISVRYD